MLAFMQMMAKQSETQTAVLMKVMQSNQATLFESMKASNSGYERTTEIMDKMWGIATNAVESAMAMQGPNMHPALQLVGQALEGASGYAEKYLAMKQQELAAGRPQSQSPPRPPMPQLHIPLQQPQPATDINGAQVDAAEAEAEVEEEDIEQTLFGEAHDQVMQLRAAIATGRVRPTQVADAILQAVNHFASNGGEMPRVFSLWQEQRFADFVDALIPSAPYKFREEAAGELIRRLERMKQMQGAAA
jgi:hypothetical protein